MRVLVIVNDQPYGSERPHNPLRLAAALARCEEVELRVFLLGDAVALGCRAAAARGPLPPRPHAQAAGLPRRGGMFGTCMDARALTEEQLVEGTRRSTLEEPTDATLWADKTLTF